MSCPAGVDEQRVRASAVQARIDDHVIVEQAERGLGGAQRLPVRGQQRKPRAIGGASRRGHCKNDTQQVHLRV